MKIEKATLIYFSPTLSTKKILNAIVKGMNIEIKNEIILEVSGKFAVANNSENIVYKTAKLLKDKFNINIFF